MIINGIDIIDTNLIGCLCWFWNKGWKKKIGILADIIEDEDYPEYTRYYELEGFTYEHCEPARKEDILFLEDKYKGLY